MTWQIRKPAFRLWVSEEGWWYWMLENDGEVVASSHAQRLSKQDVLDMLDWLKLDIKDIPVVGPGVLRI